MLCCSYNNYYYNYYYYSSYYHFCYHYIHYIAAAPIITMLETSGIVWCALGIFVHFH